MDFGIPPRVEPLLPLLRLFVQKHVFPLEAPARRSFKEVVPELQSLREEVKRRGWWAPQLPTELGGMGLTVVEFAHVAEALGHSLLGHYVFNCQAPDAANMEILHGYGTAEQKERWLAPLAAGVIRSCYAMTEPDYPGSNPVWMGTTAVREGDEYVLSGRKWFTTAADGAAFAVVMAVTHPDGEPHRRASQVIVPMDTPGVKVIRNIALMGHVGSDWDSHAEIAFENCRVPLTNLLGPEGEGFKLAQARLGPGRVHHCMRFIGVCERAFDLLCRRAAQRELAPGDPLGTRQVVQHWIADARAAIHAARLAVLHCAWKIDTLGPRSAREEVSLIKFFVANVMDEVIDKAIQAHGALGLTDDCVLADLFRASRAGRIYDGADEVHRSVVAKLILRQYGLGR
jgi:acyl-CoA dehydrogenase